MKHIRALYDFVNSELSSGQVVFSSNPELGFDCLLNPLGLDSLTLENPELSRMKIDNSFVLKGLFDYSNKYTCELLFFEKEDKTDCVFSAEFSTADKAFLISGVYPVSPLFAQWNFYSQAIDTGKGMHIRMSRIEFDTSNPQKGITFKLITTWNEDNPIYKHCKALVPETNTPVEWFGEIFHPFDNPSFQIKNSYTRDMTLPIWGEEKHIEELTLEWYNIKAGDCKKIGISHNVSEKTGQSFFILKLKTHLDKISASPIWLTTDLSGFSYRFLLETDMGEHPIIPSLSTLGKLPDEIDMTDAVPQRIVFSVEKNFDNHHENADTNSSRFLGYAVYCSARLNSMPIPLFSNAENELQIIRQTENTRYGEIQRIVIGFHSKWSSYDFLINISYPDLSFRGHISQIIPSDHRIEPSKFEIIDGKLMKSISIDGDIPSQTFNICLVARKESDFPPVVIGNHTFSIENLCFFFNYTPQKLGLSLNFSFSIFEFLRIDIEGIYNTDNKELVLRGKTWKEFSLSRLIALITGKTMQQSNVDITVKTMELSYRANEISPESRIFGNPQEFSFKCAIAYDWGTGETATTFTMHWIPDVYAYNMTASLKVLDFLQLLASCDVEVKDGDFIFRNFLFSGKIGKAQITASYENNNKGIYKFNIKDFSLGEILEELIRLIDNDRDWYLPWPYSVLKGLSIKDLDVVIDNVRNTMSARYNIDFKLLFLTVKCIELLYDRNNGDFFLDIDINGSISNGMNQVKEPLRLNLLKDVFPIPEELGENPIKISYLSIGQHISVPLPATFEGQHFTDVFDGIRKAITKSEVPGVDTENNWIVALKFNLLKAFDFTLLMCDPAFYGLEIVVTKGFEPVAPLAGLRVTVLYSKVTDTIGMFYARLTFPEVFRNINLGAVRLALGEVSVSIYTNGNFKIDLGFPWDKDFSHSFGLSYMLFTGQGGFYFGILNGSTSQQLPEITDGHFDGVVEFGIGMDVGVGLEINAGPLKAGAYVKLVAIFQGIFASYIPPRGDNTAYYQVRTTAGVVASIYGKVDFVLIQAGFSIDASIAADLTLERYRQTELVLDLDVSVSAYVRILFINIKFSFDFHWHHVFLLGENETAPWETAGNQLPAKGISEYSLEWSQPEIMEQKAVIPVEILSFFSFNEVSGDEGKEGRAAFLPLLHGFDPHTRSLLGTVSVSDSPFYIVLKLFFLRTVKSVREAGRQIEYITLDCLTWLETELEKTVAFQEGFKMEILNQLLDKNLEIHYQKGENHYGENETIEGLPFPLSPYLILEWYDKNDGVQTFDLTQTPVTGYDFADRQKQYYDQLAVDTESQLFASNEKAGMETAGSFMFCQYFYMLTRIAVSVIKEHFPAGKTSLTLNEAVEMLAQPEILDNIAGMLSRFQYGGSRVYIEKGNEEYNTSLYTYACQQFKASLDISGTDLCNRMVMKPTKDIPVWMVTDFIALQWDFYGKDLNYPAGEPGIIQPHLLPFYIEKDLTLELKNPLRLSGERSVVFFESEDILENGYRIVMRKNNGEETEAEYTKGILLHLSCTKAGDGVYGINTIGYDGMEKLERDIRSVKRLKLYRTATEFDTQHDGLYPIDGNAMLFRNNLCLEAEKPMTNGALSDKEYENSALLTEPDSFLKLLKDASLVNAGGYFLNLQVADGKTEIPESCQNLALWIETNEMADAVMLFGTYTPETMKPLVYTGKTYTVPAYHPGMLAFEIQPSADMKNNEIDNVFQLVNFRIRENEYFNESHESRPVFARNVRGRDIYSQIVPVSRLAKTSTGSPYDGVRENSNVQIEFSRVDILGNEHRQAGSLQAEIKYTDPLYSPVVWPYTCCNYKVKKEEGKWVFIVTFSWKEDENSFLLLNGDYKEQTETAYWQIHCSDVHAKLLLWEKDYPLDVQPLKDFILSLKHGEKPEDVVYQISVQDVPNERRRINLSFGIYRDPSLVDQSLAGWEKVQSCIVPVMEDQAEISETFLARSGRSREIYLMDYPQCTLSDPEYFTLPPLCNHLVSLVSIPVYNMDGTETSADFYNVDVELWSDLFIADLESFLMPDSPCCSRRDIFEKLLSCKKLLAEKIAGTACPIYKIRSERQKRAYEFYHNELLKDLDKGRQYDICVIAKSSFSPESGSRLLISARTENSNYSVKADKINADGLAVFGFQSHNLTQNAIDEVCLEYSITDKETCCQGKYDYLSWQKCLSDTINLNLPLIYKRFPEKPILISQDYETGETAVSLTNGDDQWFAWNYTVEFSHEFAAQDLVRLCIVTEKLAPQNQVDWTLPPALACYMYLREEFIKQEMSSFDMLVKTVEKVAESWNMEHRNRKRTYSSQVELIFAKDSVHQALKVTSRQVPYERIHISAKDKDGNWNVLEYKGYGYALPENVASPITLRVTVKGFDIRQSQQANTFISVTRNQTVENIPDTFVYRTEEISFVQPLHPFIGCSDDIRLGEFTRTNFISKLNELAKHFTKFRMEACCRIPVILEKDEIIQSYVPVCFVPVCDTGQSESLLDEVYSEINNFIQTNQPESEGTTDISISISFVDNLDKGKNVAEFRRLVFSLNG